MSQSPYGSFSYILYYRPQGSVGCDRAIGIIEASPYLKKEVLRQDINNFSEKPSWMKAIPILAQISTKDVWVGTPALAQLQYLASWYQSQNVNIKQPWQNYQTNLSLPTPVLQPNTTTTTTESFVNNTFNNNNNLSPQNVTPLPSPALPTSNVSSPQNVAPFPPPNITPTTTTPSTSFPTPAIIPPLVPQTSQSNGPQVFPPLPSSVQTSTEKKDPNRVQPLPPPDDQRQPQALVLPPPPKKVKADLSQLNTNTNNSSPTNLSNLPPISTTTTTTTSTSNGNEVPYMPLPSNNISPNHHMDNNFKGNTSFGVVQENMTKMTEEKETAGDHSSSDKNGIFSDDELAKIQSVLSKPKTINKRKGGNKKGSEKTTNVAHINLDLPSENRVEIINNLPPIADNVVLENDKANNNNS